MAISIPGFTVADEDHATKLMVHYLAMACFLFAATNGEHVSREIEDTFEVPENAHWRKGCLALVDALERQ